MKVAVYVRTSQEEQGQSISNQIQYLTTYLDNKGISYDKPYIDECSAGLDLFLCLVSVA